ncbi:unnamed protein product [Brassica oleracea]
MVDRFMLRDWSRITSLSSRTHPSIFHQFSRTISEGDLIHVHNKTQHDHNNIRRKLLTHVLESGIVVYSIIVGIALGASSSVSTIKPFIGAITIHQLLEGFRPRRCISKAKFELKKILIMVILYSLTTLVGIGISI